MHLAIFKHVPQVIIRVSLRRNVLIKDATAVAVHQGFLLILRFLDVFIGILHSEFSISDARHLRALQLDLLNLHVENEQGGSEQEQDRDDTDKGDAAASSLLGETEIFPQDERGFDGRLHLQPLLVEQLAPVVLLVNAARTTAADTASADGTDIVGLDQSGGALHRSEHNKGVLDLICFLIMVDKIAVACGFFQDLGLNYTDLALHFVLLVDDFFVSLH